MFAAFYFIGKNPNLTFELKPIMLALLIGNISSLFVGSILRSAIEPSPFASYFLDTLLWLIAYLLPLYLLSALAGSHVGHARQPKLTLIAEPESS